MEDNIASVEKILSGLGFSGKPVLLAVNKSDRGTAGGPVPGEGFRISAKTGEGLETLLHAIEGGLCLHRSEGTGLTRPA
jgi:50S ribosomal subunit-associated GTPase HflX